MATECASPLTGSCCEMELYQHGPNKPHFRLWEVRPCPDLCSVITTTVLIMLAAQGKMIILEAYLHYVGGWGQAEGLPLQDEAHPRQRRHALAAAVQGIHALIRVVSHIADHLCSQRKLVNISLGPVLGCTLHLISIVLQYGKLADTGLC